MKISTPKNPLGEILSYFGGKCLPKDMDAIVFSAKQAGCNPEFLEEVLKSNNRFKQQNHA